MLKPLALATHLLSRELAGTSCYRWRTRYPLAKSVLFTVFVPKVKPLHVTLSIVNKQVKI